MRHSIKAWFVLGFLGLITACGDSGSEQPQQPPTDVEQAVEQVGDQMDADAAAVEMPSKDAAENALNLPEGIDKSDPNWKTKVPAPAMMNFEAGKAYFWVLDTNQGQMKFRLYHEQSPAHVNSTIYLTNMGFYNDVFFHRVIPGFMAQGGDPTGTGMGGPAYKYDGEFAQGLSHSKAGMLSMANAGPGTDGSQFFITFKETPFLDGKHTLFGELVDGMDVLRALESRGSRGGRTTEELKIITASVMTE